MTPDNSRIEETARQLLLQLQMAHKHGHSRSDVSLCRGTVFLKKSEDRRALTELIAFFRDHLSPFDTGHVIQQENVAQANSHDRAYWGPDYEQRTSTSGWSR